MQPSVYVCEKCGPGNNKFKSSEAYYTIDQSSGNVYCLVHREHKIGNIEEGSYESRP